ncbi:MAG: MG2 domain-containing protein [Verrucomicrobiota bacterium]
MKTFAFAASAFLVVISASSAAPRLVVSTPLLVPESKIDLVLDLPVIETSEIGKTVNNTWLDIQPALPGKLRWRAQNIAEFIPDVSPVIGATYTFSIPKNRKHVDTTPVPAGKIISLATEGFRILSSTSPNRWSSDYSPSTAEWMIAFNDDIDTATAGAFISFVSKNGQRIAAKLERATFERAGYYATNYKPWSTRWKDAPAIDTTPTKLTPNILIATPVSPLPPAEQWNISVLKGLPNAKASARTTTDSNYEIGKIEPFRVTDISSHIVADQPRWITLSFNQPLPKKLPADFLEKSISIEPRPENLTAESDGRTVKLTGNLNEKDLYSVTVNRDLQSKAGFALTSEETKKIKFEHLQSLIALPSEDSGQLAHGNRKYRLFTQNLESTHLRIKKLAGADLIRAFQGYRNFTGNGPGEESIDHTAPIPYSLVVGKPLQDKEIALGNSIDTTKILTFDWNELLPKDMRYGVLFVEATGKPLKLSETDGKPITQAIIQLTDIGLAWKVNAKEALVYAFSCQTGAPLPGVKFELFGEDATSIQTATSDASGLATLPRLENARHLQASLGEDTYLTAFDSSMETVGLWHFPVRYSWNKQPETSRKAFLFTDRSLYRPGETFRLKGIIRTLHGNAIEAGKIGPARIVILDPTEKEIFTQAVTLSANGSFDFTHQLAASTTGTHLVRLEFTEELASAKETEESGDGEGSQDSEEEMSWNERENIIANARFEIPLRVEEFRRNAFEITQEISAPAIGATTVSANLTAKYYQGQPVASGEVKQYSRITTRNPYPERFRDFYFGNHRTYDYGYWYHYFGYKDEDDNSTEHTNQIEGETQLSADGTAKLSVEIPQSDFPSPREVEISTEVTDANHQTLTSSASAIVHPSSVYVGVSRNDSLANVGKEFPMKIVAIDTEEKPFTKPLKLTATVTRDVNSAVRTQTENGATTTRNDVNEETLLTTEITLDPAASAKDGQEFKFTPKSNGLHYLTLRGTDPEGRPVLTVTHFYVYGTTEYPWQYEDGLRIKLVAEKKSYKPGETARVLVLSPIEGTALVTVEREKVLRSFLVPLKMDKPVIDIPLTDADAPNAYVSVLIVKGANDSAREFKAPQLRLGICELLVEDRMDKLDVAMDAPAESYRPGEDVSLSGIVKLADGKPAVGAEVTLYAEDEGTLAVMGYETPKPMDYFYDPRNLTVDAGTSFESFIAEDPEKQSFNIKGFFVGGGGDLGKLADLMRKNFDPCATWAPTLVTDASGKFTHTFKLPDTLTRYRVIAIAHHETSRFGHAETAMVAKKDLMLEPKAPRFANQTDTLSPQVLVQNASQFEGTWQIEYNAHSAPGTPVCRALGVAIQTIKLAAGASTTVVFPTLAETTGEAVLSWKATPVSMNTNLTPQLTRRLSDAVETRFAVVYPMPLIRQVKFVKLDQPGKTADMRKALDAALLDGSGTLDLEFARSPLVEAAGSIDFLLHYPYGCVEQTTSSLIPWCAVEDLKDVIPAFAKIPEKRVQSAIQAGADRLISMQLSNGGFTYWPGGTEAVDWATPYAGLGLMMAVNSGAVVPDAAIDALKQNLIQSLRGIADTKSASALETHARALLVLSFAGDSQSAYQSAMIDRIAELTPSARAMLAASVAKDAADADDKAKFKTARQILTSKVPFTQQRDDYWMPWTPDKALELIAWTLIDPNGPEATATLDRMLKDRSPYGHWRTTWCNGWSLIAMGLYAEHEKDRSETVTLKLETNEGTETIQLSPDSPTANRGFKLGPNFKVNITGDHQAFVRLRLASKPPVAPIQPVAKNGLSIDRTYQRVNADGSATPLTEPKVGDLIRVSLRVTLPKDDTRYMVIEDLLPATFETVNSDFKSQSTGLGVRTSEKDWNISHSELRSDRAVFFFNEIWQRGTYTVTYLARCTLAGQAVAPPAKVESMYDPDNFALSASRIFNAK